MTARTPATSMNIAGSLAFNAISNYNITVNTAAANSTAVTGTSFFVPTADFLDDPPPLPAAEAEPAAAATTSTPSGFLSIGSLKGRPQ